MRRNGINAWLDLAAAGASADVLLDMFAATNTDHHL